jgi:hypothetical protein
MMSDAVIRPRQLAKKVENGIGARRRFKFSRVCEKRVEAVGASAQTGQNKQ